MTAEELLRLTAEEETIKFMALFGGTFFNILFGDAVYEKNNVSYKLPDYGDTKKLIKESLEKDNDFLEQNLTVVKGWEGPCC